MCFFFQNPSPKTLLSILTAYKGIKDKYGIETVYSILASGEGFDYDALMMATLWQKGRLSLNAGFSSKNLGASIGYNINDFLKAHGIIANSWNDTFHGRFKPKFGIGISIKF